MVSPSHLQTGSSRSSQSILVVVESATLPEIPGSSADMATLLHCFEACLAVALAVLASNDLEY